MLSPFYGKARNQAILPAREVFTADGPGAPREPLYWINLLTLRDAIARGGSARHRPSATAPATVPLSQLVRVARDLALIAADPLTASDRGRAGVEDAEGGDRLAARRARGRRSSRATPHPGAARAEQAGMAFRRIALVASGATRELVPGPGAPVAHLAYLREQRAGQEETARVFRRHAGVYAEPERMADAAAWLPALADDDAVEFFDRAELDGDAVFLAWADRELREERATRFQLGGAAWRECAQSRRRLRGAWYRACALRRAIATWPGLADDGRGEEVRRLALAVAPELDFTGDEQPRRVVRVAREARLRAYRERMGAMPPGEQRRSGVAAATRATLDVVGEAATLVIGHATTPQRHRFGDRWARDDDGRIARFRPAALPWFDLWTWFRQQVDTAAYAILLDARYPTTMSEEGRANFDAAEAARRKDPQVTFLRQGDEADHATPPTARPPGRADNRADSDIELHAALAEAGLADSVGRLVEAFLLDGCADARLHRALADAAKPTRTIAYLKMHGWPAEEIGAAVGMSAGAVDTNYSRFKSLLRKL